MMMKTRNLLLLFVFSMTLKSEASPVPVEFEWESVPGAISYEVEILSKQKKVISRSSSPNELFKLELEPGEYLVRGRAKDSRNAFSEWSQLQDFKIEPQKIKDLKLPAQESLTVDKKSLTASLAFSWARAKGAEQYLVEILNEKNEVVAKVNTANTQAVFKVRPGLYRTRIRSVAANKIMSEPTVSSRPITIANLPVEPPSEIKYQNQQLQWKKSHEIPVEVRIEYRRFQGEWKQVQTLTVSSSELSFSANKKPGEYRVSLRHITPYKDTSISKTYEFVVKPSEQDLVSFF